MHEKFCMLPFNHLYISTNGKYGVCCIHDASITTDKNINKDDWMSWWNSDYMESLRNDFIEGKLNPGCKNCWDKEAQGFTSLRTRSQKEYRILNKKDVVSKSVKNIEINLENLCNLKCLMCFEKNSSAILAENRKLKINRIEQQDIQWTDQGYENLKKLIISDTQPLVLNVRGGEPFYNKKLLELLRLIPEDHSRKILLHITTNATVWDEKWRQVLSKFRMVRIMFSIDAVGDLYEYIRYPAKWVEVEKNIFDIIKEPNVKPLIHCVLQNLNVRHLEPLVHWCQENNLHLNIDKLEHPEFMIFENIPEAHRKESISILEKILLKKLPNHLSDTVKATLAALQSSRFDDRKWQRFIDHVSIRDKIRGNDYGRFMQEI